MRTSTQSKGEGPSDDHSKRSDDPEEKVTISTRLSHITWANFTMPMSTGGLALVLASTPHQFRGLQTIGKIVFIFDLVAFLSLCSAITFRFLTNKRSLQSSITHPTEGLFLPTLLLASVNILSSTEFYGVPSCGYWLIRTLEVLFWIYAALSFSLALGLYWLLFTAPSQRLTVQSMTPAWLLPALSAMLTGTLAGILSSSQSETSRMAMIIAGVTFQGFGWSVAFIMYSALITRLLQYGLPAPNLRPGLFIAVGPPGFTALALVRMSNNLPPGYGYFATHPSAIDTLQTMALFTAIFLWMLAFWFFCIALLSVLDGLKKMSFHLVWWAMVFPNVGFTIATASIGQGLQSQGIQWVASAMTIMLVIVWIFVLLAQIRAIWRKEIYMPGKDEDKDEYKLDDEKHGIKMPKVDS